MYLYDQKYFLVENTFYLNKQIPGPSSGFICCCHSQKPLAQTTEYQMTWLQTQGPVLHTSAIRWFSV